MADTIAGDFILGIDLGTNSVGWAIVGLKEGKPSKVVRAGARVFEAGMDGDIESGREESRNKVRRDARLHRRQLWRRKRRLTKVFNLLQRFGLLPSVAPPFRAADVDGTDAGLKPGATFGAHRTPLQKPEDRQDYLNLLDQTILASSWFAEKQKSATVKEPLQVLPYLLRACALDEPLEPHFLGRALYHLAQRRGFLSNRKAPPKKDEKPGEVDTGIAELRKNMDKAGARTLGEYFANCDPFEKRIRQRWTHRSMYENEFDRIWKAQSPHHPNILTPERHKELFAALFYQRPIWFPSDLVGTCELEPGERRAPRSSFVAQRFRLLQTVNNLRLELPSGQERLLTADERAALVQALELKGDHTFAQVRKLPAFPKDSRFTIERGGEKKIMGNRTTAKFYAVFGERWLEMSAQEHQQAYLDVLGIQKDDALERRAINHWRLDEQSAKKFANISFEPDYFKFSRKAIERLMPLLETGVTEPEARHRLYPEKFEAGPTLDSLPRLDAEETRQAVGEIRNPAVTRSLTEMRKVVNAVVRSYGKPAHIRLELARDLKRSKKDRQSRTKRNRDNEEGREKMKKKILEEAGLANPSRTDVRKALLHDECGGVCPYTGKSIDFRHLYQGESQFDIEHIIPFERCFDSSFSNLTLCDTHENSHVKNKRTPWEAYHGDESRFEEILDRVKRFRSPSAHAKLWRFKMTETEATEFVSKFVSRQLNDTRYASKLAAKYVAMLYGGLSDDEHLRRVHVTSGEVTAQLRRAWLLNRILNDGPTTAGGEVSKTRDDHRHHAVDAVAIALTDDSTIQQLSRAAERARDQGLRKLDSIEGPWGKDLANFVDSVREAIKDEVTEDGVFTRAIVSHRVSKKVSGALHEETIYSAHTVTPHLSSANAARKGSATASSEPKVENHVRKPVAALTKAEMEDIVDPMIRSRVLERLGDLGGDVKKFATDANLPFLESKDGSHVPIKHVRVKKKTPTFPLGAGRNIRHVTSESNHHLEVFAELDENENEVEWDGKVVSRYEAYHRMKSRHPMVQKDHGPHRRFKFSLSPTEVLECDKGKGNRQLMVVRSISQMSAGSIQIGLVPVNDARLKKEIVASRQFIRPGPNTLRQWQARKVGVSPLGEVSEAHD